MADLGDRLRGTVLSLVGAFIFAGVGMLTIVMAWPDEDQARAWGVLAAGAVAGFAVGLGVLNWARKRRKSEQAVGLKGRKTRARSAFILLGAGAAMVAIQVPILAVGLVSAASMLMVVFLAGAAATHYRENAPPALPDDV